MPYTRNRNIPFIIFFLLLVLTLQPCTLVRADTRYVSDMLIITLRENPDKDAAVIRSLTTDTPVEVLEESGRYLKVKTGEGEVGWVGKQYITQDIPKPHIISGLKNERIKLNDRIRGLEKNNTALKYDLKAAREKHLNLKGNIKENQQEISGAAKKLEEMTKQYNTLVSQSKNVVELLEETKALKEENKTLKTKNRHINTKIIDLNKEITSLIIKGLAKWAVVGAGIFIVGMILGKASKKRKDYY